MFTKRHQGGRPKNNRGRTRCEIYKDTYDRANRAMHLTLGRNPGDENANTKIGWISKLVEEGLAARGF
jgi:hypothetical protein